MAYRVIALLGFFTAVSAIIGAFLGLIVGFILNYPILMFYGALLFFLVSLVMDFAFYYRSPKMILKKYHAKLSDDKKLNGIVDRIALNARVPKPKVYILPIDVPNSLAVGRSKDKASICVTEGVLNMNEGEIESAVAHEMWHIANNDVFIQNVTAVAANILYSSVIFSPVALFIVKLAISERREYLADYYGTRYSKKFRDMGSALSKINEIALQNPMSSSPAFECLWIANPYERDGYRGMFSTHPPTARRVKRIDDMVHEGIPETPQGTEVE